MDSRGDFAHLTHGVDAIVGMCAHGSADVLLHHERMRVGANLQHTRYRQPGAASERHRVLFALKDLQLERIGVDANDHAAIIEIRLVNDG